MVKQDSVFQLPKEQLKAMFLHFPFPLAVVEEGNLQIIFVNDKFTQLSGYSLDQLDGKLIFKYFTEKKEQINTALNSRKTELSLLSKTKKIIPLEVHAQNIPHGSRKVLLLVFRDLSQQKKYEKEINQYRDHLTELVKERTERLTQINAQLMDTQGKFQRVISSISAHVYVTEINEHGQKVNTYISPNVEDLTGYKPEKFIENWDFWPQNVIHSQDREAAEFQANLLRKGKHSEVEYRIKRKNGEVIWVRDSARVEQDKNKGTVIYGIVSNITDHKLAETELVKAKQTAEHSLAVKEEFVANISHEIRTPMNVVTGMTELMNQTELTPQQKEYLEVIRISSDNLIRIINDILDISKIDSGRIEFAHEDFSIQHIFHEAIQTMQFKAGAKGLSLSATFDSDIPEVVIGDGLKLKQILLNVLENAVKYTDKGSIKATAQAVQDEAKQVTVKFSVKDTGRGIPKAKLPYVFESFAQLNDPGQAKNEGTGLGLAIVKKLVELQGGTIKVTSKINKGTTFTFTLSFAKGRYTKPSADEQSTPLVDRKALHGTRVLLVEDNEMSQLVAESILEKLGAQVAVSDNGKKAVQMLEKNTYDVVLMDLELPIMDGLAATKEIRNGKLANKEIPIIALTAHASERMKEEVLANGMNDFVTKPFDTDELYEKMSKILARRA